MNISKEYLEEKSQELCRAVSEAPPSERPFHLNRLNRLVALQQEFDRFCARLEAVLNDNVNYIDILITHGAIEDSYLNLGRAMRMGIVEPGQPIRIAFPGTQLETITSEIKESGYLRDRTIARMIYTGWGIKPGDVLRFSKTDEDAYALQYPPRDGDDGSGFVESYPRQRRSPFRFSSCGIGVGEKIQYDPDPVLELIVCDDKHVTYQGKRYSLSALIVELLGRKYPPRATRFFSYQGQTLYELAERSFTGKSTQRDSE